MLRRITKHHAKKLFADGNSVIILCPCKMVPDGPFSLGCRISGKEYLEKAETYRTHPDLWKGTVDRTAWDLMYRDWEYYNTSNEMGNYAHYYVEVT